MMNFQDLGVMLAAGQSPLLLAAQQGTQIGAALETSGAQGKQVFGLLKEAALSMLSPENLITIGAIAMGAALSYGLQKAIPRAKSLADALNDLESALSTAKNTAGEAANLDQLAERYGRVTREVTNLAAAGRDMAKMDAEAALRDAQESFQKEFEFNTWWDSLRGYPDRASLSSVLVLLQSPLVHQPGALRDHLDRPSGRQ